MYFAERHGDHVWALPEFGEYAGGYADVRFFALDNAVCLRILGGRFVRFASLLWVFLRAIFLPRRLFFVHSFIFAIPLWVLRRNYCIFIHGSDRRFVARWWGQRVIHRAIDVFGVGFGIATQGSVVKEVPNIFVPVALPGAPARKYDVLFVLRNAPVKNPLFPIDLARELGKAMQLRIGVVGVSEHELPESRRLELTHLHEDGVYIDYLGRQSSEKVTEIMRASRIFLLPSLSEGIPKAVLEAMYQGMEVVVNRDLRLPEAVMDHCQTVKLGDWPALAELLEKHLKQEENSGNVLFAQEYLKSSQDSLISLYDGIYSRFQD